MHAINGLNWQKLTPLHGVVDSVAHIPVTVRAPDPCRSNTNVRVSLRSPGACSTGEGMQGMRSEECSALSRSDVRCDYRSLARVHGDKLLDQM